MWGFKWGRITLSFKFEKITLGLPWQTSAYDAMLPLPGARVRSLVGELRSRRPCGTVWLKKKKKKKITLTAGGEQTVGREDSSNTR